jgi:prevent-host-death family protein
LLASDADFKAKSHLAWGYSMDGTKLDTTALPGRWGLQDPQARLSELVRRVRSEGPQHVIVQGCGDVVVIAAEDLRRLQDDRTGQDLIDAIQSSPYRDIALEVQRAPAPVRNTQ